jgi:hypothetical protein
VHITGTVIRPAYATTIGVDPTTWDIPNPTDVTVENSGHLIGTATVTIDTNGDVVADIQIDPAGGRWTHTRPYLGPVMSDTNPNALIAVGVFPNTDDADLTGWTEEA